MIKDVDSRIQNKRIVIALSLCILYLILCVVGSQSDSVIAGVLTYLSLLVYGFICLCRIILTEQKRTFRYILPLILIVATLIVVQFDFWPYAKYGYSFHINISR